MRLKQIFSSILFVLVLSCSALSVHASSSAPNCANITGDQYSFKHCTSGADQSQYYLGIIFGDIGTVLFGETLGNSSGLLGEIFRLFNVVVLTLGSLITMYIGLVSTLNTAQEGSMMGKKWSAIWIPIRSIGGLSFLLPLSKGYSLLQVFVMWIVLQGVGAANLLWGVVLDFAISGQSINQPSTITVQGLNPQLQNMLNSMICLQVINSDLEKINTLGGSIELYKDGSGYSIGIPGDLRYSKICGGVTVSELPPILSTNIELQTSIKNQLMQSLPHIYNYLALVANEAVNVPENQWALHGALDRATQIYNTDLQNIISNLNPPDADRQALFTTAKEDGWITAGYYYYKLLQGTSTDSPLLKRPPLADSPSAGLFPDIQDIYTKYLAFTKTSAPGMSLGGASSGAASVFAQPFIDMAISFINHLKNSSDDPLVSLHHFGSDLVMTVEVLWMSSLLLIFPILITAYNQSWSNPTGYAVTVVVKIITSAIYFALAFLWGAGILLALYVPSVPYIVFTFTTIGWMMLVIEAIVAAPVLALAMTVPSNDHLGRTAAGLVLLVSIFLRPSLMIFGFILSTRIYLAAMQILQYSITEILESQIAGVGLFGSIALIVFYAGVVITVAHKCFTLIYVIPDRIIRWIGGHAENSGVAQQEKQLRQTAEQGGEAVGGAAKGATSGIGQLHDGLKKQGTKKPDASHTDKPPATPAGG